MRWALLLSLLLLLSNCQGWLPSVRSNLIRKNPIHVETSSIRLNLFALNFNWDNNDDKDRENGDNAVTRGDDNGNTQNSQSPAQASNKIRVSSDSNNDIDTVDSDFPTWVEGLKSWPRYPSMNNVNGYRRSDEPSIASRSDVDRPTQGLPPPAQTESEDMSVWSSRYRGSSPLSNLINLEALLEASSTSEGSDGTDGRNETEPSSFNIFAITEQLMKMSSSLSAANDNTDTQRLVQDEAAQNLNNITTVEEFVAFEKWMETISKSVMIGGGRSSSSTAASPTSALSGDDILNEMAAAASSDATDPTEQDPGASFSAESILKEATSRIEFLVNVSSTALSPSRFQSLIVKANEALSWTGVDSMTDAVLQSAARAAQDRGLDVQQVTERAWETTRFAVDFVTVANDLFGAGYAVEVQPPGEEYEPQNGQFVPEPVSAGTLQSNSVADPVAPPDIRPLFADFESARVLPPLLFEKVFAKLGEMGPIAGTVYEDTFERCQDLGHMLVANGTTAEVAWMVTDSVGYQKDFDESLAIDPNQEVASKPVLIRTITIRGFDASDESVDREKLLNVICSASGATLSDDARTNSYYPNIVLHSGLLSTARELYKDLKRFMDSASPEHHRIVLNGHSIGGSLSILMLLLATVDIGAEAIKKKVLRVYAHGSPPIASLAQASPYSPTPIRDQMPDFRRDTDYHCEILDAFGLPSNLVHGYIQPWDPIVRFLTEYDALYPLVDDLGADELTLYATGPPRTLRPLTRAILQSWDGWPQFRESWRGTNQKYRSVGIQHVLLPEPLRYINDRFVSTNIGVPETETVVRISSRELLPALETAFPLDVFKISFVPEAIRSFLHHFYPAYDFTVSNYAEKVTKENREARVSAEKKKQKAAKGREQKARLAGPFALQPDQWAR